MLDGLIQQFAGGSGQGVNEGEVAGAVAQMFGAAPNQHATSAVSEALGALGAGGFGQSVAQGAANAGPQERNGLADMLLNAVCQGGGSPNSVLSQLGINGSQMGPEELGQLAEHVAANHPGELSQLLGSQLGGSGGTLTSLLGNPMARQLGTQLAQKLL